MPYKIGDIVFMKNGKIVVVDKKTKKKDIKYFFVDQCPFCGSKNIHVGDEFVECLEHDCWAMMKGNNERHAIMMWNRRGK